MPSVIALRCRPTAETLRAAIFVVCFILVLGLGANLVPARFLELAGKGVTIFYVAVYYASLSFAGRQRSLAALGITQGRWLVAIVAGIVLGSLGTLGVIQDFPGGTLVPPCGWRSITALVCTGFSAGFIEAVVFYGYFQFRLSEAFGAPIAILGTTLAWIALHASVLAVPGAGTFSAQHGVTAFLVGIGVGFLLTATVVQLTHSVWAGALPNIMANIFVNLYMLSVRPEQVIIADPKDLPIAGLMAVLIVLGLALTRQRIAVRKRGQAPPLLY